MAIMDLMTTNHAEKVEISEIIDGPRSAQLGSPGGLGFPDRRSRWAATALAVLIGAAAVATAVVLAVSVAIIGLILFAAGLVLRLVMAIRGTNGEEQ